MCPGRSSFSDGYVLTELLCSRVGSLNLVVQAYHTTPSQIYVGFGLWPLAFSSCACNDMYRKREEAVDLTSWPRSPARPAPFQVPREILEVRL